MAGQRAAADRKSKRQAKAGTLWARYAKKRPQASIWRKWGGKGAGGGESTTGGPPRQPIGRKKRILTPRQRIRAQLDALWSLAVRLRDRRAHGPLCRLGCGRIAVLGYHLVPKQRGDSIRWLLENGVAACSNCNGAELLNRSLYREKHVQIFGRDLIERLEEIAREKVQFKMPDLVALRETLRNFCSSPT